MLTPQPSSATADPLNHPFMVSLSAEINAERRERERSLRPINTVQDFLRTQPQLQPILTAYVQYSRQLMRQYLSKPQLAQLRAVQKRARHIALTRTVSRVRARYAREWEDRLLDAVRIRLDHLAVCRVITMVILGFSVAVLIACGVGAILLLNSLQDPVTKVEEGVVLGLFGAAVIAVIVASLVIWQVRQLRQLLTAAWQALNPPQVPPAVELGANARFGETAGVSAAKRHWRPGRQYQCQNSQSISGKGLGMALATLPEEDLEAGLGPAATKRFPRPSH